MTTKPAASACSQCHDHKAGGPATEALFGGQVTSCAKCHHEGPVTTGQPVVAVIPPIRGSELAKNDRRYRTEQTAFSGFIDSQFHPRGGACAECHKANGLKPLALPIAVHIKAVVKPGKIGVHSEAGLPDCLGCHCKPTGVWKAGVSSSTDDPVLKALRGDPDGAGRSALGNQKEGFPGSLRVRGKG